MSTARRARPERTAPGAAFAFAAQKTIKFYRQATDELVGLSDAAAAFLGECF